MTPHVLEKELHAATDAEIVGLRSKVTTRRLENETFHKFVDRQLTWFRPELAEHPSRPIMRGTKRPSKLFLTPE